MALNPQISVMKKLSNKCEMESYRLPLSRGKNSEDKMNTALIMRKRTVPVLISISISLLSFVLLIGYLDVEASKAHTLEVSSTSQISSPTIELNYLAEGADHIESADVAFDFPPDINIDTLPEELANVIAPQADPSSQMNAHLPAEPEELFVPAWSSLEIENSSSVDWADWDGDGDLDLAVGNKNEPNSVYENTGAGLIRVWQSDEDDDTNDIAWGDWDNDGDPDLAVGNWGVNRIYENMSSTLILVWSSPVNDFTRSVEWGNWDADELLELAIGNFGQANYVYENSGIGFTLAFSSTEQNNTTSLSWGDWNGDGYEDLAEGNWQQPNMVYASQGVSMTLAWSSALSESTNAVDWGDWNSDGFLDLAVGNGQLENDYVYENLDGSLEIVWTSPEAEYTNDIEWNNQGMPDLLSITVNGHIRTFDNHGEALVLGWSHSQTLVSGDVSWGDWNGDGAEDIVAAFYGDSITVFENASNKGSSLSLAWSSNETDSSSSIVWGDWDGDGDLDLAVGNRVHPSRVYANVGTDMDLLWNSPETVLDVADLAWGDWDGDGDLDLAIGSGSHDDRIFENLGGDLDPDHLWASFDESDTTSVAFADVEDGPGQEGLEIARGNYAGWISIDSKFGGARSGSLIVPGFRAVSDLAWGDYDGDGDLDLAVGSSPNLVYINEENTFSLGWTSPITEATTSIAWGDWDGDGDLDLAVGTYDQPNNVYSNVGGDLRLAWSSQDSDRTFSVAWGDWDGDGDLDLAVGNAGQPNRIYANVGGALTLAWSAPMSEATRSVAWGDWDGDGDLDLAVGNYEQENHIYENTGDSTESAWLAPMSEATRSVAWGDWDGDGDLDLAVGNEGQPNRIYANDGGALTLAWSAPMSETTRSVAWGDWDGDGDLDLAVGNEGQPNRIYANDGGALTLAWSAPMSETTRSVAWGDWDGDGDLDLAVGNEGQPNRIYANDGGALTLAWSAPMSEATRSVAWGDWDGDGDLDLAVGNGAVNLGSGPYEVGTKNRVYENIGNNMRVAWTSPDAKATESVAWGDWDGDGDLDLAIGNSSIRPFEVPYRTNQPNQVFDNVDGTLELAWTSPNYNETHSVAWGDWDGDGDVDLGVANTQNNNVFVNLSGDLTLAWSDRFETHRTNSIAWADWDGDGDLDLAFGSHYQPVRIYERSSANLYSLLDLPSVPFVSYPGSAATVYYGVAGILSGPILPISYTLFDANGHTAREVRAYYSLNGPGALGGDQSIWYPAIPASNTQITELAAAISGTSHVFNWDMAASGVFGASDNVVFRLDVYQGFSGPGPYQYEFRSYQTLPFRIRGGQVLVISGTSPMSNAQVFRQDADSQVTFVPFSDNQGRPLLTNPSGYLQGFGQLEVGASLIALAPISSTGQYTLYHASAVPTLTGLEPFTITAYGVQTLTVAAENSLLLFNLDVSLEWDARNDHSFLEQLENDLQRTSQVLYDLTNGQVGLGRINVYHSRDNWEHADIIIQAANDQRPAAILGGVVLTPTNDYVISDTTVMTIENAFLPGQVRMGATWNRFGDPGGTLGEDWPRALAHELGHYLLFMPDNYLGISPEGFLQLVDCEGSAMSDPYAVSYSEFLTPTQWTGECLETLAEHFLDRSDWETILTQYSMLNGIRGNPGPSNLPLAVTNVQFVTPTNPANTIVDPIFNLQDSLGNPLVVPVGQGQGYLYKENVSGDPNDDYVIRLGSPVGDLLLARGAEPGDELCVYDFSQAVVRFGCVTVGTNGAPITLHELQDWTPQIEVNQVTTNTFAITVTQNVTGPMHVQLLPSLGPSSPEIEMIDSGNGVFTQTIVLPDRAYAGYVRISAPGLTPTHEFMGEFAFVGEWSGKAFAWGGKAFAWGGKAFAWGAPVLSSDGQVALYDLEDPFGGVVSYTLEALPLPPELPAWFTLVGNAYRVDVDGELPNSAILFRYLGRDVPGDYEDLLQVYYLEDGTTTWVPIDTELDTQYNHASATLQESGIYALIVTIEYAPFMPGWHNVSYPLQHTQAITQALASIDGSYNSVLNYNPDPAVGWRRFDTTVQAPFGPLVNTLTEMEFLQAYWLHITQPVTLYLGVENGVPVMLSPLEEQADVFPPATYYGWVEPSDGFTPTVGSSVQAWIGDTLCGETSLVEHNEQLAYAIHVEATDPFEPDGCGEDGALVTFMVDGQEMNETPFWENGQSQYLSLTPNLTVEIYLPIVVRPSASAAIPIGVQAELRHARLIGGLIQILLIGMLPIGATVLSNRFKLDDTNNYLRRRRTNSN